MILESVIAANAAFKVIKVAISNGKEIADCAKAMGAYLSHKEKIEEQVENGGGSSESDLEAFYELEKLNRQELDLKFIMNKQRLGMWVDFQKFKERRKKSRASASKSAARSRARRANQWSSTIDAILKATYILLALTGLTLLSLYMILNFER